MTPLKERRKALRLTQEALASASDVSQGRISMLERGAGRPFLWEALRLGEALGMDPPDLFPDQTGR